jgi:hypothetical protein
MDDILPVPVQLAKAYLSPIELKRYKKAYDAFYNINFGSRIEDIKDAEIFIRKTANKIPEKTAARVDMELKSQQLRSVIEDLKKSGKTVYSEWPSDGPYEFAAWMSRIFG